MAQAHNMDHLVLGNINALTLEEGVNYHMIPGKQKNSKLFIKGKFAYKLDKAVGNVRYLVCKFLSCIVLQYQEQLSLHN